LIALLVGAVFQFVTTRLDEGKYPPPGQMVDVAGHAIHLDCSGSGSPTVVLEAGLGGGSLDWALVQPEVAKFGRVCSYDRAGFAWSPTGPGPRDASRITDELHQLLTAANIAPPYVMAGHSIGGVYVQLFAARYPDEVAGVVLVDSSHAEQLGRIPGIPAFVPYLFRATAVVGIHRIVNRWSPEPDLSAETNEVRSALYSHTRSVNSVADEMSLVPSSLAELRATPMQLGDKPLVVLARGIPQASPNIEADWLELQKSLAQRSSNGKLVVARNSGHYIHFSEPELVVDAIRRVMQSAAAAH